MNESTFKSTSIMFDQILMGRENGQFVQTMMNCVPLRKSHRDVAAPLSKDLTKNARDK